MISVKKTKTPPPKTVTHAGSAEWEGEGDLDSAQDSNKNCIFYSTLLVRIIIYTQLL